ncbi:class B sortase, partial [Christensenellaceae bacterium OttesenSCG-928-K19]|nr:class B sortase [Christensenellaceae bacterium OttesenSCG-928-K19]
GTASFGVYMHLRRKKGKRRMVAAVALALCVALIAASGYMLAQEAGQYTESAAAYGKLADHVMQKEPVQEQEPREQDKQENEEPQEEGAAFAAPLGAGSRLPSIDFDALLEVNLDIRAWLVCEGTGISYPVAQAEDNSYYLKRLYDGARNKAGCLFIDYENAPFTDKNTIIYGHNLLDGSMFSELIGYQEQDYYDAHPDMLLATPNGGYIVEVFAAFVASPGEAGTDTSPWRISWEDDAAYSAWLEAAAERSLVETDVTVGAGDQVLTLSTCIKNGRDRFIVMGRLVPAE